MKKQILYLAAAAMLLLGGCTSQRYKATDLKETNDSSGWNCTFKTLDGDLAKGFNINSGSLRIESSIDGGKMTVYVTGNGENVSFDGANADRAVPSERFGDNGDVLYVTLKCEDAKNGKVRVVWEE